MLTAAWLEHQGTAMTKKWLLKSICKSNKKYIILKYYQTNFLNFAKNMNFKKIFWEIPLCVLLVEREIDVKKKRIIDNEWFSFMTFFLKHYQNFFLFCPKLFGKIFWEILHCVSLAEREKDIKKKRIFDFEWFLYIAIFFWKITKIYFEFCTKIWVSENILRNSTLCIVGGERNRHKEEETLWWWMIFMHDKTAKPLDHVCIVCYFHIKKLPQCM